MRITLLVPVIALILTVNVHAQRVLPEELALARAITMQEDGEIQVTPSIQYFKLPQENRLTYAADLEYGVTERLELDAEVPYVFRNPSDKRAVNGLGDTEVAIRYAFVPVTEKSPFAFNAGLGVTTPTGSQKKETGEGQVALGPFFTASEWLGPVNLQLNSGWTHTVTDGGQEPRDEFEYNVAILYPVRGWFLAFEANGETNHERTKYYLTPEIIWSPKHSFQIQLAVPIGVTRATGDYGIIASVTMEFEGPFGNGKD